MTGIDNIISFIKESVDISEGLDMGEASFVQQNGILLSHNEAKEILLLIEKQQNEISELKQSLNLEHLCNIQNVLSDTYYVDMASDVDDIRLSTKLIIDESFGEIPVTSCCGIGPITDENFCPKCGQRIEKNN